MHYSSPSHVQCPFCAVQDSNLIGAGYETAIKGGALAAGGKAKSRPGSKAGTKKVRGAGAVMAVVICNFDIFQACT